MPGGMSAYEIVLLLVCASAAWLVYIFNLARQIKRESIASGRGVGVGFEPRVQGLVRLAGASILALLLLIAASG